MHPTQAQALEARIEAAARDIAIRVAKNCGSVPNLTFPDIYLGLKEFSALSSPSSTVMDEKGELPAVVLPPLPEHDESCRDTGRLFYSDHRARSYALAAVEADRRVRATLPAAQPGWRQASAAAAKEHFRVFNELVSKSAKPEAETSVEKAVPASALPAKAFHLGAQNDAWFIIYGERPALGNDHPNHEADRTCVAKVFDEALARALVEAADEYLTAQGALDNRELMGPNAAPYEELRAACNSSHEILEDAISVARAALESSAPSAASEREAACWRAMTEVMIDEFLVDYEMRGEDEQGRDACYAPSEGERALIKDAIMGLFAEAEDRARALANEAYAAPSPGAEGFNPLDYKQTK